MHTHRYRTLHRILISGFLIVTMMFALAGCGKSDASDETMSINGSLSDKIASACTAIKESDAMREPEEVPMEEVTLEGAEAGSDNEDSENESGSGEVTTEAVSIDPSWTYADSVMIGSGQAVLYHTGAVPKGITVGVNAGHGTSGGTSVKTYCHPDRSAKVTGGTTAAGSVQAVAVSSGMTFSDGTPEPHVTLREAQILRDKLLAAGYDVLMIRDGDDVQLDNVARTVLCNNLADCHIALHWDGDGLNYDKGCFYIRVPDGIKYMEPVASMWQEDDRLGQCLIDGLRGAGASINGDGSMAIDLTQTSYSTVPSVDIELGNQSSNHSEDVLNMLADGLLQGVEAFFGN